MAAVTAAAPDRLRVLFCDHLNLARGKWLPARHLGGGAARFCLGLYGVTYCKDLIPASGAGVTDGLPDLEAVFDGADVRPGWDPGTQVVVADLRDHHGAPLPLCGRGALRRAIADWRVHGGLEPMVGIELEAYAYQVQPDGTLVPYDTPGAYVYGTGTFADPRGFTDAIWRTAEAAGFRIDSVHSEYDSPQFEFTLTYDSALRAVDDIFLFRLLAREVALRHGIVLTFLPKPIATQGGSGVHVNFSFADAQGVNQIRGAGDPARMNALTRGAIAGLMHHHAGLAGLVAPCVNSYARLKPASMSGYWRNWGVDHRGVTVRVGTEEGPAARLEHRMGDGAANPYTLVAAVLQAARLGVENGHPLPAAEGGDGFVQTDAQVGVADDLSGALSALEADSALVDAVGAELVANHVAVKRVEIEKLADRDADGVRDYYIRFI